MKTLKRLTSWFLKLLGFGREKVPAGLQVWDSSGNLAFDSNDRLAKMLGLAQVSPGVAGSVYHSGLSQGTPFAVFFRESGGPGATCRALVSGNTVSWSFSDSSGPGNQPLPGGFIIYGVM